jgi:UTP--glucose-1-phosphate uridylyltransferase
VKDTNDLLVLRSDAYALTDQAHVQPVPAGRAAPPFVDLDQEHFKRLDDFESRFPFGPPSLVGAERFAVRGDVSFGRRVVARGVVEIAAPPDRRLHIADGTRL